MRGSMFVQGGNPQKFRISEENQGPSLGDPGLSQGDPGPLGFPDPYIQKMYLETPSRRYYGLYRIS